jgi:hypothetical protein
MADSIFDFNKFIEDSKQTLLAPKEYFTSMAKEGGYGEPVIKALIYGLIAGIISFIWALLNLSAAGGMLGGYAAGGASIMIIIFSLIGAIIGLFIGGIIMLIISAICGGNTNYEANVRVVASLMVLSPVNALLSFTMGINFYLGSIISLLVMIYGIWLLYNALVSALTAKEGTAKVVSIIIVIIPVILLLSSLLCVKAATTTYQGMEKIQKQMTDEQKKTLQDLKSKVEEMKKKSE